MSMRRRPAGVLLLLAAMLLRPAPAAATLATDGFRAVGIAHAAYPISAVAVAPDGRLFATIQARGQTTGSTPGQAEIRVYSDYRTADGSRLDEGLVWAQVDTVRATTTDEGLLGIALAPDFATSKLVYVYLTTTDSSVTQEIRVFRENASGTGDYLGVVKTPLEPPAEQATRSGGALAFGADGCLYVGVGDNGGTDRWNAQVFTGTNGFGGTENGTLCTNVCNGAAEYPDRTVANNDGNPNPAGKVLRLAVEGPSTAAPGPSNPFGPEPDVFGAGFRNPVGFAVHPLTGQLYASERGDSQQAEIDVVDQGTNQGWPCLEGATIAASGVAACLAGKTPADVYANHPAWRRPIVTHTANPVITGLTAYTGDGYPSDYYGDVFYLLRDSARIYRIDLDAPCFLPHPGGVTPVAFHDSANDGDFQVLSDFDGNGTLETLSFFNLTAMVQAPNPLGQQVLYVVGRQDNSNALTADSVIFRIEYAKQFTPYAGPTGHVPDSCFTDGTYSGGAPVGSDPYAYENPFHRITCLPPGGTCPGQADGTPCEDGDICNGAEACAAGVCRRGTAASDGTACTPANPCLAAGSCQSGACQTGGTRPDGTPCPDDEPCNGLETCVGGECQAGTGPAALAVRSLSLQREGRRDGSGALALAGTIHPAAPLDPAGGDAVTLALREGDTTVFQDTLAAGGWRSARPRGSFVFHGRAGGVASVKLKARRGGEIQVDLRGRRLQLEGPSGTGLSTRLVIGDQCFEATPSCTANPRRVRCR